MEKGNEKREGKSNGQDKMRKPGETKEAEERQGKRKKGKGRRERGEA